MRCARCNKTIKHNEPIIRNKQGFFEHTCCIDDKIDSAVHISSKGLFYRKRKTSRFDK